MKESNLIKKNQKPIKFQEGECFMVCEHFILPFKILFVFTAFSSKEVII